MTGQDASRALDAWMRAIASRGWYAATLDDAAIASGGLPGARIMTVLGDKVDALAALLEHAASQSVEGASAGATVRERLFDGLMQGFDVLQGHRDALRAIEEARDPGVALLVAARTAPALRRLAAAAGMSTTGLSAQGRIALLALILGATGRVWREDTTADMAATMAELDRQLERAERAATDGPSLDLIGLPGLSAIVDRFRPGSRPEAAPGPDPALPPAPGLPGE
jgi:hypothetical protein